MNTYYVAGIPFDGIDAISHHGIKGQKWGVRRYQNPDGTLTEEGKARYLGDNFNNSVSRIHNAWSKREASGENYKRWAYDTGGEPIDLIQKGDDWKFFLDSKIRSDNRLRNDVEKVRELQKKAQSINPFGSKKRYNEWQKATKELQEKGKREMENFIGQSLAFIDQLPKKDREAYESYVFELLGWDQ